MLLPIRGDNNGKTEIAFKLKNLPLGEHRLINIIKLIVDADQFQKKDYLTTVLLVELSTNHIMIIFIQMK